MLWTLKFLFHIDEMLANLQGSPGTRGGLLDVMARDDGFERALLTASHTSKSQQL